MASKKKNELHFEITDEDYKAFGYYRIMYTEQGRKLVMRQRITYLFSAVAVAGLFTVFHVDKSFTILAYVVAAALAVVGLFFAEKMVLRQQDKAIESTSASADRVHAPENTVTFDDDEFITKAGEDVQHFKYTEIKLADLTEEGIYVWLSDEMIMPLPKHAFINMDEMKACYKFIKEKAGL